MRSKSSPARHAASGGKVTLEMVAQHSGVSPATVSRILNGTAVVSDEKREAVDRAIAELGFVPNPIARGLAGGRTLSVGVITQAIDSPFYGVALRGIEEVLDKAGYIPLFVSGHWDADEEKRCIEVLRSRRVDGLIVLTGRLGDAELGKVAKTLPTVITGRVLKAPGLYSLQFDDFEGARLATEHLLQLGHRRIAFIAGDPVHPDAVERLRGYKAALQAAGLKPRAALQLQGSFIEESGREAVQRLLASGEPFSAIFAANDQMAFGAALALYEHGLRVPEDVSLVGFDDLAGATHSIPPLTTVQQPGLEMGRLAASSLLQLLAGERPKVTLPKPQLVVRASTRRMVAGG
ncbi:LacI family DNA-binding transcriptional regulator [Aquabacterium humicola]|uniref:LacI family DNA-binding transcriptional regulator n=1 Tax=Aquabacterium humicola TaxID=3237377 RepID=UPI002542916D|nr:LacI family DNA-binding transcriptional regulator [Rubrivivax pictus]